MKVVPYDRYAAVDYARQWAFARNPAYSDFDGLGGDCTNFISQCIYAGSKVMNYTPTFGWYYRSLQNRTASWSGVEFLFGFLVHNLSVGPFGHVVSEHEAEIGDIIQLRNSQWDYYHTLIIVDTLPYLTVAAHTFDAFDRPLFDYRFDGMRIIHIDGVRIW